MSGKGKKAVLAALFLLGVTMCIVASVLPVQRGDAEPMPGMSILFWGGAVLAVAASAMIVTAKEDGKRRSRFDAKRTALCGVLLSLMLILGWVERMIPMPHGIKLGLSNSVLIFAVCMLDIPTAYVLMIYKVFLSNLLFGNLGTTFMMGFAGGLLSLTAMVGVSRIKGMHTVTVSIVGGVCHNVGQVFMAMLLMENAALISLLPWLMISGMGFGALTGVAATMTMKHLKHMRF